MRDSTSSLGATEKRDSFIPKEKKVHGHQRQDRDAAGTGGQEAAVRDCEGHRAVPSKMCREVEANRMIDYRGRQGRVQAQRSAGAQ